MVSVIITAFKESRSVPKAVERLVSPRYNNYKKPFELLIVCPDRETWKAAKKVAEKNSFETIRHIKDPGKGKPRALNKAFKEARGNILILTDGDVFFGKNVISKLSRHFRDKKIGGVTGRPISRGNKDSFMQFANHFYADVAHHKRLVTMIKGVRGHSLKIVSKEPGFFVLSGYISAIRNVIEKIPEDCLADDAYISYILHNKGYKLAYEPEAHVFVKYAQHIKDWYKQKLRSVGGYVQLWKYGVITKETKVRNFRRELEYALWFPIHYVKNVKEAWWAFLLYPTRLWLWIQIFWQQKVRKKSFDKTWVRIESTK